MCSPSWTPLPLPSPSHPSGPSQCPSPEHLSHASNLEWQSVSQLIIYIFQWYSLRSSHPRLLPQSPKSVLYICDSFSVLHIAILQSMSSPHCYTSHNNFILNLTVVDTIFKTAESKHLFQRKNSNDLLNLEDDQNQYFHMPVTPLEVSQVE